MTASIMSNVEKIDNLRFTDLRKGQIAVAKRVLRVDEREYLIELENGQLISTPRGILSGNCCIIDFGITDASKKVLDSLVKMKILTRKQVDEHIANRKRLHEKRNRKYAIQSLQSACEELGIPMPKVPD